MKIAISGGGRTGHLYAVLFKQIPDVRVAWHSRRAGAIAANMPAEGIQLVSNSKILGAAHPDFISSDIAAVVEDADMVIFTQQNEGLPSTVRSAAQHLGKTKATYVGVIPALGNGFDWLIRRELPHNENVFVWGLRGVPVTSPAMSLGQSVTLGGWKERLYVGYGDDVPAYHRTKIREALEHLFRHEVSPLQSFLEMTLSPASLHPAVLYGIMGPYSQWDGSPLKKRLRWWADLSELSAYFLKRCDQEMHTIVKLIERRLEISLSSVGTIQEKQIEQYGSSIGDRRTLMTTLRTTPAHQSYIPLIEEPGGGFVFDKSHAGFRSDLFFSMVLYLEAAARMGVRLPYIKEVFEWGCDFIGEKPHLAIDYLPTDWLSRKEQT